jgi:hypothetical protein
METFEQQEKRARQRLRPAAVVKAALVAGLITFLLPGGGPWMSFDSGIASMGRVMSTSVWIAAAWQVALALAYGWTIAALTFSMSTLAGIVVGALMSIPLYAVNHMVIRNSFGILGNEVHAGIAHFMFCLLFAAIYRAMAVPAPRATPREGH